MDGNGRGAKRKSLSRSVGHDAGAKAAKRVINYALKHKIPYLTLFAFSSENWRRPKGEVKALFSLLQKYFHKEKKNLTQIDVKVKVLGSRTNLSTDIKSIIKDLEYATKLNKKLTLMVAFNYSSRNEILLAFKSFLQNFSSRKLSISNLNEKTFSSNLMTKGIPDPDLVIRTSGEQRLSNFLLWQSSYSELLFLNTLWPDFTERTFKHALSCYSKRKRRFGRI